MVMRVKNLIRWAATMVLLTVVACGGTQTKTGSAPQGELMELWVKAHLVPCKGWEGQNYCFAVSDKPEGPWSLAYDGLQNFYYQWGYSYQLLVARTSITKDITKENVKDLTAGGLKVVKITKKKPATVGTAFDFTVDPQLGQLGMRNHLSVEKGAGQILMGPAFTCETMQVCDDIKHRLASGRTFVVTFVFGVEGLRAGEVRDPGTVVEAIAPAATASSSAELASTTTSSAGSVLGVSTATSARELAGASTSSTAPTGAAGPK